MIASALCKMEEVKVRFKSQFMTPEVFQKRSNLQENALMLASKTGRTDIVRELLGARDANGSP